VNSSKNDYVAAFHDPLFANMVLRGALAVNSVFAKQRTFETMMHSIAVKIPTGCTMALVLLFVSETMIMRPDYAVVFNTTHSIRFSKRNAMQ
jgi:hypothetical protein